MPLDHYIGELLLMSNNFVDSLDSVSEKSYLFMVIYSLLSLLLLSIEDFA